jgi:hypothetical protein
MQKFKDYIKKRANTVIAIPAWLCFITFIINFVAAMRDGFISSEELHQLLTTADGFETVVLFIVAFVLRDRKR